MRLKGIRSDILTAAEIDDLLYPVNDELAKLWKKLGKKLVKSPVEWIRYSDEFEQLSVEALEFLAVKFYKRCSGKDLIEIIFETDLLRAILRRRFRKLNIGFEWTQENKKRFIEVNDKITQVFEKAYKEALSAAKDLENRLNNNDDFIKDYEIEIKLHTHTSDKDGDEDNDDDSDEDGDEDGIGLVLSQPICDGDLIHYHLNSCL